MMKCKKREGEKDDRGLGKRREEERERRRESERWKGGGTTESMKMDWILE